MHPYLMQAVAVTRMQDVHRRAAESGLARQARRSRPAAGRWQRLARWLADALADQRHAARLTANRRASVDRHLLRPGSPPGSYREFLARTSGPLRHEPPAAARSRGRAVR